MPRRGGERGLKYLFWDHSLAWTRRIPESSTTASFTTTLLVANSSIIYWQFWRVSMPSTRAPSENALRNRSTNIFLMLGTSFPPRRRTTFQMRFCPATSSGWSIQDECPSGAKHRHARRVPAVARFALLGSVPKSRRQAESPGKEPALQRVLRTGLAHHFQAGDFKIASLLFMLFLGHFAGHGDLVIEMIAQLDGSAL